MRLTTTTKKIYFYFSYSNKSKSLMIDCSALLSDIVFIILILLACQNQIHNVFL